MDNKICLMVPQGSYGVKKFYGQELGKYLKKNHRNDFTRILDKFNKWKYNVSRN